MLNQTLNSRYQLKQSLSKKQARETFLALDLTTNTEVIVKIISFNRDLQWQDVKLFEREAATLKALNHPSIPAYLDYFETELDNLNLLGLVQTKIEAISLEEQMKNGRRFSESEIIIIAKELLHILIYLHELSPPVIHRDIKPSNILLTDRSGNSPGKIYLIDFGSVQNATFLTGQTMTIVGTYGYMPLEQFGGKTVPSSDIYSLGATLSYLITGTHPADLPQKDGQIDLDNINTITPALINWLKKAIAPYLFQRFDSAKIALNGLENLSNFANLTLIKQPKSSKIKLNKNNQQISIYIPPIGWDISLIFTGCFAIAWNSFIFFWTLGTSLAPFPMNIPFLLFSLPFWAVGLFLGYGVIFPIFGKTYFIINQNTITLTQEILFFRYQIVKPTARDEIYRLVYNPKHFSKDSDGDRITIPAKLIIYAGKNEYKLEGIATEIELEWLAQELSQWLNLPIIEQRNQNYK